MQPKSYKNWYYFPNTTLSNIDLSDCNDTINGICQNTSSLEECIDICENDPEKSCVSGYFIETPDKHNFCVPLKSNFPDQTYPYYRLQPKNHYKELNNVKSTVFASKKYQYPPYQPNLVFYLDSFYLQHVSSGLFLSMDQNGQSFDILTVQSKNNALPLRLIPGIIEQSYLENYSIVKDGDTITINVPGTGYFINYDSNSFLWKMESTFVQNSSNSFIINHSTETNPNLFYGEHITFKNSSGYITFTNDAFSMSKNATVDSQFILIPNVKVYYCENNKTQSVSLADTDIDKYIATYKGNKVYRNPKFWNCGSNSNNNVIYIALFILITFSIVILYIRRK